METGTKGKSNAGRPKAIANPEEFWRLFTLYEGWNKRNPIKKQDFKGKDADEVHYKLERPMTWTGFDAWLFRRGVISRTEKYRANFEGQYDKFVEVIKGIDDIMLAYQVEGAMVGVLKENLVARLNGIREHTDNKTDVTLTDETKIGFE